MQTAVNHIASWAEEWIVTINKRKTETSIFSLSPNKETVKLSIKGENLPIQETPTYLGVKLDRRLTWSPQITVMENKGIRKMAVMKKLSGTSWGSNSKILTQVYTGSVRPHLEYGATSWGTAAKTNTSRLTKVQNSGLRIITGALKTTPIETMEKTARLQSLEERRSEKNLRQAEKVKRISTHPLKNKLREPTKNRLKRQSPNHLTKANQKTVKDSLPILNENEVEPLIDYVDWRRTETKIELEVPNISEKKSHSQTELKTLTQEHLNNCYPSNSWTQVFTDGSSENAVQNGGGGILIKFPSGNKINKSIATGKNSTNFRAEACAILNAAKHLNSIDEIPTQTVILSDCKSVLQSLQGDQENKTIRETINELKLLQQRTTLILQWIPSHCGISGNEEADKLSKEGSKLEQPNNPIDYDEVKTMIKATIKNKWKKRLNIEGEDSIHQLRRADQVLIFRLRTGHCRLLSHMYKMNLAHTDECQCQTGKQTVEHVLRFCPTFETLRAETWSEGTCLEEMLYGPEMALRRTAEFVRQTKLTI